MIDKPHDDHISKNAAHQAVSIWEKGVQKERDGSMNDAIKFYRQALKIDEKVEKVYRKKLHEEWALQKKLAEVSISPAEDNVAAETKNERFVVEDCQTSGVNFGRVMAEPVTNLFEI